MKKGQQHLDNYAILDLFNHVKAQNVAARGWMHTQPFYSTLTYEPKSHCQNRYTTNHPEQQKKDPVCSLYFLSNERKQTQTCFSYYIFTHAFSPTKHEKLIVGGIRKDSRFFNSISSLGKNVNKAEFNKWSRWVFVSFDPANQDLIAFSPW